MSYSPWYPQHLAPSQGGLQWLRSLQGSLWLIVAMPRRGGYACQGGRGVVASSTRAAGAWGSGRALHWPNALAMAAAVIVHDVSTAVSSAFCRASASSPSQGYHQPGPPTAEVARKSISNWEAMERLKGTVHDRSKPRSLPSELVLNSMLPPSLYHNGCSKTATDSVHLACLRPSFFFKEQIKSKLLAKLTSPRWPSARPHL